ncbi:RICIN domain-containing protein [Streptomyces sp. NEAU-W12]|uniref:RICIN domain-containing protein n=1 Tax=Streptomyces sp. NEAU-W12 TaxID=2994668 RepID=UPI00224AFD20|nr:RICIN domain-containing protein [Streptomyces sp. NEAU-W12]MCX2924942.1 RICIN domain-containing protein [Streptomyces sp. NEAU-W12]MCX2927783.1 RICIN domain-containing protein [Streptomyces sp. NEAU-W12]
MPTPCSPRSSYPSPGGDPGESDESLAARLRGRPESEGAHSVAMLTTRHWPAMHDYATVCLASSGPAAAMVTAAAQHRVLNRVALGEPAVALRPVLLVAVRDTVREWASDDRSTGALPELLKPAGGRGMRAARTMTPENRTLAHRSFRSLPGLARCVLWHVEVEAEPVSVPAGLLGIGADIASSTLQQARETFRQGCVQAHQELAPTKDCRFYNRLLDVPIRRGGTLLPDVRQHLAECRYCRNAAEQLSHFEGDLGTLIAEAVLGWGARRYLDSRPGRATPGPRGGRAARRGHRHGGGRSGGSRHRLLSRIPVPPRLTGLGRPDTVRSTRTLLTGLGAVSAGVLVSVLIAGGSPSDGSGTDPTGATSAADGRGIVPTESPPGVAGLPTGPEPTLLRNIASGLCLDTRGEPQDGTGTRLAGCSSRLSQQWTYEEDGLLRSVADPGLCLDAHKDAGVVVLATCADAGESRADDVRYDLTEQGELLPRWDEQLALVPAAPGANADIVIRVRDRSENQRWLTEPVSSAQDVLSISRPRTRAAGSVEPAGPVT